MQLKVTITSGDVDMNALAEENGVGNEANRLIPILLERAGQSVGETAVVLASKLKPMSDQELKNLIETTKSGYVDANRENDEII